MRCNGSIHRAGDRWLVSNQPQPNVFGHGGDYFGRWTGTWEMDQAARFKRICVDHHHLSDQARRTGLGNRLWGHLFTTYISGQALDLANIWGKTWITRTNTRCQSQFANSPNEQLIAYHLILVWV